MIATTPVNPPSRDPDPRAGRGRSGGLGAAWLGFDFRGGAALLVALFAIGLVLRIALCATRANLAIDSEALSTDEAMYLALATHLKNSGTFATPGDRNLFDAWFEPRHADQGDLKPNLIRTPGFPALLVLPLAIRASMHPILALHIAMQVLICVGFWLIGKRLGRPTAGVAAGIAFFLDPLAIFASTKVLPDAMLLLLFVAAIYGLVVGLQTKHRGAIVAGFVCIGLAAITKPIAVYLIVPMGLVWVIVADKRNKWREGIAYTAIASLIPAMWVLRNELTYDVPVLSSAAVFNAVEFEAMAIEMRDHSLRRNFLDDELTKRSFETRDRLIEERRAAIMKEPTNQRRMRRIARDVVGDFSRNPQELFKLWYTGLSRLLLNGVWTRYLMGSGGLSSLWHGLFAVVNLVVLALALRGFRKLARERAGILVTVLIGVIVVVMATLSAPSANSRLRVSFFPLLYLPMAVALLDLGRGLFPGRRRQGEVA